jgi:hypothetical protein
MPTLKPVTKSQSDKQIRRSSRYDENGNEYFNPTINLKDHPINVVLRNSNAFLAETFLRHGDKKADLKKVQQLCNFFKIALPYAVKWNSDMLKSKEFLLDAKERILILIYETINKENGLIRPD